MVAVFVVMFLVALAVSASVTPWVRAVATRLRALDEAHSFRKIHVRPIPQFGGLGFVAGVYAAVGLTMLWPPVRTALPADGTRLLGLAVSGLVVVALGVWDDLRGAGAKQKFVVQLGVALLLYSSGHAIHAVDNPFGADLQLGPLALPVTLLWITGVSNAMNLIDGLDGLAGGIALTATVVAGALALHSGNVLGLVAAAALAGGLVGFLVYNVHPASIFMGDTGSLFLGTTLAAITLWPHDAGSRDVPLLAMVVALGVPIADTTLAMVRRMARGAPVFSADREHIHHRLLDRGLSQGRAVQVLWGVSAALAVAGAYLATHRPGRGVVLVVAVAGLTLALVKLGLIRFPRPGLGERRRRNRERLKAVREACARMRDADGLVAIHAALSSVAAALGASSLRLRLVADAAPSAASDGARTFPIVASRERRGALDVTWLERGQGGDRDADLAIDLLCRQLSSALERVGGDDPSSVAEALRRTAGARGGSGAAGPNLGRWASVPPRRR